MIHFCMLLSIFPRIIINDSSEEKESTIRTRAALSEMKTRDFF